MSTLSDTWGPSGTGQGEDGHKMGHKTPPLEIAGLDVLTTPITSTRNFITPEVVLFCILPNLCLCIKAYDTEL